MTARLIAMGAPFIAAPADGMADDSSLPRCAWSSRARPVGSWAYVRVVTGRLRRVGARVFGPPEEPGGPGAGVQLWWQLGVVAAPVVAATCGAGGARGARRRSSLRLGPAGRCRRRGRSADRGGGQLGRPGDDGGSGSGRRLLRPIGPGRVGPCRCRRAARGVPRRRRRLDGARRAAGRSAGRGAVVGVVVLAGDRRVGDGLAACW